MGVFKNAAKETMLDAFAGSVSHGSLHDGYPATTGNELSGGSPAYARVGVTFGSASGNEVAISNEPEFNVPAGDTVSSVGFCTSSSGDNIVADDDVDDEAFNNQGVYTVTEATFEISDS